MSSIRSQFNIADFQTNAYSRDMKRATKDILHSRYLKIVAAYDDADIQLDDFLAKFEPQFDLIRQRNGYARFKWTDPKQPKTIDNLEWSAHVLNPDLMTLDMLRNSGVNPKAMDGILTFDQWIDELKSARNH